MITILRKNGLGLITLLELLAIEEGRSTSEMMVNVDPNLLDTDEGVDTFERIHNCVVVSSMRHLDGGYSVEIMSMPS